MKSKNNVQRYDKWKQHLFFVLSCYSGSEHPKQQDWHHQGQVYSPPSSSESTHQAAGALTCVCEHVRYPDWRCAFVSKMRPKVTASFSLGKVWQECSSFRKQGKPAHYHSRWQISTLDSEQKLAWQPWSFHSKQKIHSKHALWRELTPTELKKAQNVAQKWPQIHDLNSLSVFSTSQKN